MKSKLNMICGLINDLKIDCYCKMDDIEAKMPDPYMDEWYCLLEEAEEYLCEATDSLRKVQKMIEEYESKYDMDEVTE